MAREAVIRPRIRKLIGTVALLALVVVWSFLAMALAQIVLAHV
jgi:cell division septal protein FtsQ